MKVWIGFLLLSLLLPASAQSRPREIFKIEIGSGYEGYSNQELRRRVWELERAVAQLQDQVFHLSVNQGRPGYGGNSWTCHIQSFGKTFTATKSTRGAAQAKILKDCSNATNAMHCKTEDVSCDNQ